MKKLLILIILSFIISVQAQESLKSAPRLFPIKRDAKIGYIDKTGKLIIEPQFESGSAFTEGLACVKTNGQWQLIDESGMVVALLSNYFFWFSENLAIIELPGGKGYINRQGNTVIKPQFEKASSFFEGLAHVKKNGKYFFIDKNGKKIFNADCYSVQGFSEGLAGFVGCGKHGFIDKTGRLVFRNESFIDVNPFSEGLARVLTNKNYKYGYINKTGSFVIAPQFEDADSFRDGLAGVKINGKYGFIDKTGIVVIENRFDSVGAFFEGLATAEINDKEGFINKSGDFVIPPKFSGAYSFSGGLAKVYDDDGKYWYINQRGQIVSDACSSC